MSSLDRRNFLKLSASTLIGVTLGGVTLRAMAKEQVKLDEPMALAMKYVHQSSVEGQTCGNCVQVQGKGNEQWRGCTLFPGKTVHVDGWCVAWSKKP